MTASEHTLHFSVALDLRHRSDGALAFAQWLRKTVQDTNTAKIRLSGLHVIEPEQIAHLRDVRTYDDLIFYAQRGLKETLERSGAEAVLDQTKVLDGGEVVERLASELQENRSDALIIGRVAPRDAEVLNRLGKVARHLLRSLVAPTIVVPPDLRVSEVGQGPLVVALDGTDTALGAVNFARRLALDLRRQVVGVHVVGVPDSWGYGYVSPHAAESAMQAMRATGERALEQWAGQHALSDLRLIIAQGVPSREVVRIAQDLSACMVVTGSRRLSTLERFFVTSVGSEVAASAQIPVAVVPSELRAHAD